MTLPLGNGSTQWTSAAKLLSLRDNAVERQIHVGRHAKIARTNIYSGAGLDAIHTQFFVVESPERTAIERVRLAQQSPGDLLFLQLLSPIFFPTSSEQQWHLT
jgi:hypothetical protein